MEVQKIGQFSLYHLRMEAGADLFQGLRDFLQAEGLSHAFVLTCIGSCSRVVLAYPKTAEIPPEVERISLEGPFEINGISGDVKRVGSEIRVHLHGSVTKDGREVMGGAIGEGTEVFKMAELLIVGVK